MFVLTAEIRIADKVFRRVSSVKIESSRKTLEDVATIELPTTARLERAGEYISEVETAKTFAVGDQVTIRLGYDGDLRTEFSGYIRKIKPQTPLVIECEDATYLLKRKTLKKSFRATTLESLLNFILADTGIELDGEVPVIKFTHFYFKEVSAAKALQKLKDEYGLTIYFKDLQTLFVGLTSDSDGRRVKYEFTQNIISSSLEWEREEDKKLYVKAVNVRPDNTIIEKQVGDPDGEKRTIYFYDLDDETSLAQRAKEEILKYRYDGYKGDFVTFLLPVAQVGNIASITDPDFPERSGDYLVDEVVTTFGQNGARRKITLGLKVTT